MFSAATPDEIHFAQLLTGATMALLVGCPLIPGIRRHALRIRIVVATAYIIGCVAFTAFVLLR